MTATQTRSASFPIAVRSSRLRLYLHLVRPRQWSKNLIVLAALVFSGHWCEPLAVSQAFGAALSFSLLAAAVYCINDCVDAQADRLHLAKRRRPIAAGLVSVTEARIVAVVLASAGLSLALTLDPALAPVLLLYGALNLGYTLRWKAIAIVDVMIVASGFLLRAVAGALVLRVTASAWLLACTTFLSLFLALVKRRQELLHFEHGTERSHRSVLAQYSIPLLDQLITSTLTVALLTYILYSFFAHQPIFMFTVVFVVYGLFRYLYLVHHLRSGGSPEEVLLTDRPILLAVLFWGGASALLVLLER